MKSDLSSAGSRPTILGVCGPTASGKSKLAVALAHRLNGEIINLDSVQVYRGCDIGSAKPSEMEREGVPHHCFDLLDPITPCDVAFFRAAVLAAIGDITSRGRLPIVTGGAGMYLTALLHGLAEAPKTDSSIRELISMMSTEQIYSELQGVDLESATKLHVNDRQRLSRALEFYRGTGEPLSKAQKSHEWAGSNSIENPKALLIVLCSARDQLYSQINQRTEVIISKGLLEETTAIYRQHGECPALKAIGYREALAVVKGALPPEDLTPIIAQSTRQYAKRQMTYFRNEPVKRGWLTRPTELEDGVFLTGLSKNESAQKTLKGFRCYDLTLSELTEGIGPQIEAIRGSEMGELRELWYVNAEQALTL